LIFLNSTQLSPQVKFVDREGFLKFFCNQCNGIAYIAVPDVEHVACGHCNSVIPVPKSRFDHGVVIADDYILLQHVGTGGMGLVYKAHQISLERVVAIKILKDSFSKDQDFISKFVREARSAALLRHQNIVQSYAIGNDEGTYFIAMEFVDGQTISEVMLRNNRFSEAETIKVAISISEALDYAWQEKQLLHRDVKPDNIMISKDGNIKLMDMGLSCSYSDLNSHEEVIGTPQYISPDQLLNPKMDFRGDQYSLGATLYHMLTGQFPFDGDTAEETAMMHIEKPLTPPQKHNSKISNSLASIISKMMAKSADQRFQSSEKMVIAMKKCTSTNKMRISRQGRRNKKIEKVRKIVHDTVSGIDRIIHDTVSGIEKLDTGKAITTHFRKTAPYSNINDILKYSCIAIVIIAVLASLLFLIK
jgi:eukaryotic-like serine/threonine-protein kinase